MNLNPRTDTPRRTASAAAALLLAVVPGLLGGSCGSTAAPAGPGSVATPSATPTPASANPPAASACALTAPRTDCATRVVNTPDLANDLQEAVDAAARAAGVMYADDPNRVYDLARFRAIVVSTLDAKGLCGAWDYGNEAGDEIYVRSADGCVTEQYDLITGDGGVRPAKKSSLMWQDGWGPAVPAPKPAFSKEGDLGCALPGDRSTFCVSIKNSPGEYGRAVYDLVAQTLNGPPAFVDPGDHLKGRGEGNADALRLPAWRIVDVDAYIAAIERTLRANGYCAFVEKGDILKVKMVSRGNVFHEEIDVVENPPTGGAYVSFVVKDRCHDAGF